MSERMAEACRHENADHLMPGERWALFDDPVSEFGQRVSLVECLRCVDCGEWLSLGPANNGKGSDFTIKMEIRAAALAVMPAGAFARNDEWAGWDAHDSGDSVPWEADGDESQCWQAGYLARCIATHDEGG